MILWRDKHNPHTGNDLAFEPIRDAPSKNICQTSSSEVVLELHLECLHEVLGFPEPDEQPKTLQVPGL